MLNVNDRPYDFSLEDHEGTVYTLSSFLGRKVVLYFYPKDDTPGCSKQACAFRDSYTDFINQGFVVIGISKDSKESHRKFVLKYQLPFILLSDENLDVIKAFGVWVEKKLYGKTYMGVARATFIINEEGIITHVFPKASPTKNAIEILKLI